MTESEEDGPNVEYAALCYDSWGRANNGIDALINMIKAHNGSFNNQKEDVSVIMVKGTDLSIRRTLNGVSVTATEKKSEEEYNIKQSTLNSIGELYNSVRDEAKEALEESSSSGSVDELESDF